MSTGPKDYFRNVVNWHASWDLLKSTPCQLRVQRAVRNRKGNTFAKQTDITMLFAMQHFIQACVTQRLLLLRSKWPTTVRKICCKASADCTEYK